nr:hypothetical protein [Tanacetum cinerariifolium]
MVFIVSWSGKANLLVKSWDGCNNHLGTRELLLGQTSLMYGGQVMKKVYPIGASNMGDPAAVGASNRYMGTRLPMYLLVDVALVPEKLKRIPLQYLLVDVALVPEKLKRIPLQVRELKRLYPPTHILVINGFYMSLPGSVYSELANSLVPRMGIIHGELMTISTLSKSSMGELKII